jgi:hypothetical protein
MATQTMWQQLPKLDDDDDVGVVKEQVVIRDGEADLKFRGTLLASAAPTFRGQDRWREYRVYRTAGDKYVFSKIGRSMLEDEVDKFEAQSWPNTWAPVFKVSGKQPEWKDAVVAYFRFDPVAKELYRKLGIESAERID